jgi:hypothetical protein
MYPVSSRIWRNSRPRHPGCLPAQSETDRNARTTSATSRYGQKHDVVVVNFLKRKNAADQYVYQLLSEKFQLFEGVFGASDEVLGAIESGVDFEKRVNDIYQRCRKHEEIKVAFDQLQLELSSEINEAMTRTRRKLLENFDDGEAASGKFDSEATATLAAQITNSPCTGAGGGTGHPSPTPPRRHPTLWRCSKSTHLLLLRFRFGLEEGSYPAPAY